LILSIGIAAQADVPVFEIGKFSLDPRIQVPQIQPLADYMASQMEPFGYQSGKARVYSNFDSARQALANGSLDTMTTSLYEEAQMIRGGEPRPNAIKWKNGLSEYSSLIVVEANSVIYDLKDLVGKTIAFEDSGLELTDWTDSVANSQSVPNNH
jgi:phosphonate transport system substrate-binding protein